MAQQSIESGSRCNPVQSSAIVPSYVVPWSDLIEIKVAITRPDVTEIARSLESFEKRGVISVTQCGEYGLIDVRQHDFSLHR